MRGRAGTVLLALFLLAAPRVSAQKEKPPSLKDLERAAVVDSNDPITQFQLAMAYEDVKRWDDAEARLREAIKLAPEYADAELALAMLPELRGDHWWKNLEKTQGKQAVDSVARRQAALYKRAFLTNPLIDLHLLPRMKERVGSFRVGPYTFRVWWTYPFAKAVNMLREGKFEDALKRFDDMMKDSRAGPDGAWLPDGVLLYHGLAAAHLGRYAAAVEDYWTLVQRAAQEQQQRQIQVVPMQINEYRYLLATMLYLDGRFNQALPVFRRTLEFDVGLYQSHVQMARIYEASRLWAEAIAERQAAVNTNPEDASLVVDLGATYLRAGRVDSAVTQFRAAAARAPRDPRVFYLLGVSETRVGDTASARRHFQHFLDIAPSRFADQIAEVRQQLGEP